jgi:Skp family chaperone for outer membrane proteins
MTLPALTGLDAVSAADLKFTETDATKVDASGAQNPKSVKEMDQSIEKLNQREVELTHDAGPAEQAEAKVLMKDTNETLESITKMLKAQEEAEKEIIKNAKSSAFSSARHKTVKRQKTRQVKPLAHVVKPSVPAGKLKLVLKLNHVALNKLAGKRNSVTVYVRVNMILPSALYKGGLPRSFVQVIKLKRTPASKGHHPAAKGHKK